jgi:ammonium transporter, Amt family
LGYDDSLDAFGVRGIDGIIGAIGTRVVASLAWEVQAFWDYVANGVAEFSMAT